MTKTKVFTKSYYGFGDCIWLYPFIKELCNTYQEVYLETFFPFLFHSLPNLKFIKPLGGGNLHTCKKVISNYSDSFWCKKPVNIKTIVFPYYLTEFKKHKNLVQCFDEGVHISTNKIDYSLPLKNEWIEEGLKILTGIKTYKKICILKLPSDRKDWRCLARTPKPEYYQRIIDKYKDEYYFISIGNKNTEIYLDDLKNIDLRFEHGELSLTSIMGLASLVDMIITYNCFFYPLGLALKTKTFVIGGGYTDPRMYTDFNRVDTTYLKIITPEHQCTCINRSHCCQKEINVSYLDNEFASLSKTEIRQYKQKRHNMLICRMRAERAYKIATNPYLKDKFEFFTVDHTSITKYVEHNLYKECYKFPQINDILRPILSDRQQKEIYEFCKNILIKNNITVVLNAQPLHPYNKIMRKACEELNIEHFNTETFCDDKWLFDKIGGQYTNPNEIYKYINQIPLSTLPIDLPKTSRQPQPSSINRNQFFKKYGLQEDIKYVVFLGQLLWDMSVKYGINISSPTYEQFVDLVLKSNLDITFLVKHHPIYIKTGRYNEVGFFKNYSNVIIINESLETLFNIFNNFVSFSSTTIFEGLIKYKKFVTMGFHFCNNDKLVLQLFSNKHAKNLYNKIENFNINSKVRDRYLRFVCNYYSIDLSSKKLYDRLIMSSDKYFSQVL